MTWLIRVSSRGITSNCLCTVGQFGGEVEQFGGKVELSGGEASPAPLDETLLM